MARRRGIIIFFMVLCLGLPAFSQFTDVPRNTQVYSAIQKLLEKRIITPSADRKFNGDSTINMYQMALIFDRLLRNFEKKKQIAALPLKDFYTDIPARHPSYLAVRDLVKLGVFSVPPSRKFWGEAKVDRYTFYSYFVALVEGMEGMSLPPASPGRSYLDVREGHPAYPYLQKLIGAGLLSGGERFEGKKTMTRAEMAIFIAGFLDYYTPATAAPTAVLGYVDIPEEHFARQAVNELIQTGILPPGRGRKFYGDDYINRYYLFDFIGRIIEKIMMGGEEELTLASSDRAYLDVPFNHFSYRSIQKLIALGVIPAGNLRELFHGERQISRYQMVYFMLLAMEQMLSNVVSFQAADYSLGYGDVPQDHYVYESVQKLIWLGVLEGGPAASFKGEENVTRYELCFFAVNLIKAAFLKLEEAEEMVYEEPLDYGFEALLATEVAALNIANGKGEGEDLLDVSANQSLSIYLDRRLNQSLSAFADFTSQYYFGDASLAGPYLNEAHLLYTSPSLNLQFGRSRFYAGMTPFANSLFINTRADMILASYLPEALALNAGVGKLVYSGDVALDSNFGFLSLSPKLPLFLDWANLNLGGSWIADLPDPDLSAILPTRLVQGYAGIKVNLLNLFELSAEMAKLDFSNQAVLATVGASAKEDTEALQCALTYFSKDYGYSLSLGYQKIGDDYYLSRLAQPASYLSTGQNTESLLFMSRYYPDSSRTVGIDLANVMQDNFNIRNVIRGYYNLRIFDSSYLDLSLRMILDNSSAQQNQLDFSSSFSVYF